MNVVLQQSRIRCQFGYHLFLQCYPQGSSKIYFPYTDCLYRNILTQVSEKAVIFFYKRYIGRKIHRSSKT